MFDLTPVFRTGRRTVYDPFRALEEFERSFWGSGRSASSFVGTDVVDNGASYSLITDLPGFKKEDISIDISGDTLTLTAERKNNYENRENKDGYVHVERSFGSYTRSFDISGIDADKISAKYEDGVLTVDLPKVEEKAPESRKLEIQ